MKTKKILSLLLCMLMLVTAIPFSAGAVSVISDINAMIPIPVAGTIPSDEGVFVNTKAIGIDFDIDWCHENGVILASDERFQYGKKYLCVLDISTEENYMFSNEYQMSFVVNGKVIPDKMVDYRSYSKIYINYEFTPSPILIDDFDVTIPVPFVGDHPTSLGLVVDAENISYNVEWLDENMNVMTVAKAYEPDKEYYCCIDINADESYAFKNELKINVNGSHFNYAVKSDSAIQVMYIFKASPIVVKSVNPEITLPEVGETLSALKVKDASEKAYVYNQGIFYANDTEVAADEAIKADTDYYVAVLYFTNPGYTFANEDDIVVNGGKDEVITAIGGVAFVKCKFRYSSISVENGTASEDVALNGEKVTLKADETEGEIFSHWEIKGATATDKNDIETEITVGDEPVVAKAIFEDCDCNCHGNFFQKLIFKITNFFASLFNPEKKICECGVKH